MTKILAFAGSARKESLNKKLLQVAVAGAENTGAEVTLIDMADYPMPIFDQDLEAEQGIPKQALAFKQLLLEHQGFLIASPEYNSAFSPLLKNAIDWASRAENQQEPPLAAFRGKVAGIMSASPGALGGMRGLVFLRMLLGNLGIIVLPNQQAVGGAFKAFNDQGSLIDNKQQQAVLSIGRELAETLAKLGR